MFCIQFKCVNQNHLITNSFRGQENELPRCRNASAIQSMNVFLHFISTVSVPKCFTNPPNVLVNVMTTLIADHSLN
jgi:hypothetical protein